MEAGMSRQSPEQLLARHEAFLRLEPADRPLLGFWLGGYYPAEQFPTGTARWRKDQVLTPADVTFEAFAEDYANLERIHADADDDFFYVGSAYWGMPWMEAILGCPVVATRTNCRAEPCRRTDVDLARNRWFEALARFTVELVAFADGRFPVCPPLLRGPGDCVSAMLGGMEYVMSLTDEPKPTAELLAHCNRVRSQVVAALHEIVPAWHGTHAAGGYPSKMWCRRTVAYNQDDSAALLSPDLFRQFLLPLHRESCRVAEVNFIHLHSSCLYPVDILLADRCYDVLEVNMDHPGGSSPTLPGLLPALQRVQAARVPLLLWGELSPADGRPLRGALSPVGLSLQAIIRRPEQMPGLLEVLR
jgi:hypothetical protein